MLLERRAYCQSLLAAAIERWARSPLAATAPIASSHDRRSAVFNVRDYGALGNGVADDLAAIQTAVQEAEARFDDNPPVVVNRISQAPLVYFPPGTYRVTGTINVTRQ